MSGEYYEQWAEEQAAEVSRLRSEVVKMAAELAEAREALAAEREKRPIWGSESTPGGREKVSEMLGKNEFDMTVRVTSWTDTDGEIAFKAVGGMTHYRGGEQPLPIAGRLCDTPGDAIRSLAEAIDALVVIRTPSTPATRDGTP
jgi:septal ring factor EnvC (AmiA/AmiB activator)